MDILDEPLTTVDSATVEYAGVSSRFTASLIDFVVLIPVMIGLHFVNFLFRSQRTHRISRCCANRL
jgi:hypothetical protein